MNMFFAFLSYGVQIGLLLAMIDCAYYLKKIYNEMVKNNKDKSI